MEEEISPFSVTECGILIAGLGQPLQVPPSPYLHWLSLLFTLKIPAMFLKLC